MTTIENATIDEREVCGWCDFSEQDGCTCEEEECRCGWEDEECRCGSGAEPEED